MRLSSTEKTRVIEICKFFYPTDPPNINQVTEVLVKFANKILLAARDASYKMGFIPKPLAAPPRGVLWLFTQAARAFWNSQNKENIRESVRASVARDYRTEYITAKMGMGF